MRLGRTTAGFTANPWWLDKPSCSQLRKERIPGVGPEPGDNGEVVVLGRAPLSVAEVVAVARSGETVEVAPDLDAGMAASRGLVERAVADGRTVYGVTTGFG
ncbi:MAG: aromatic amino acid lyase, partial [Actinobacteria bacterium]|nr:aromatic amino acid lyase [Actinomycetota bacterium]